MSATLANILVNFGPGAPGSQVRAFLFGKRLQEQFAYEPSELPSRVARPGELEQWQRCSPSQAMPDVLALMERNLRRTGR